jgi:hypothetical protein
MIGTVAAEMEEPMRVIGLIIALSLAGTAAAGAQTLLETVLYIASMQEPADNAVLRDKITQDGDWIYGEVYMAMWSKVADVWTWTRTTLVKRVAECKFEVDDRQGPADPAVFHPVYTIDFSRADLEHAHPEETTTALGFGSYNAIVVPGERFCLLKGRPNFNDIGVGSCADAFFAQAPLRPNGPADMLAAVRRLRQLCILKVS